MNCPQCGKPLRRLQVETMLGKPGYNAWCREGFCSQDCYRAAGQPEGLQAAPSPSPEHTTNAPPKDPRDPTDRDRWTKKDPLSYSMATYCLLSIPAWLAISILGVWNGVYREPAIAFWFSAILGGGLMGSGLICGVAALFGMRRHGPRRILWKSLIGIALILGYGSLLVLGYQEQQRRAAASSREGPPPNPRH